ncbi:MULTISPECIES: MerR family transcriptional regulator [Paenibacillus]|uniref:MerR family transcriptional regulator n=1 Tax=Paenibacillus TaxID=44249 RepID=UPI0022B87587|nr:MerR family transcriptional regulator [Paenibacillus caseinilyticus]MCZ8519791.1 MerR family transcriptional regulator [Paenibacillus caseinilyticus]
MRPVDLAREFMVSTNTLRSYEARGLVPPAARSPKGYRMYTEEHRAYVHCLRAMAPGFGMDVTREVLGALQAGDLDTALWTVGEAQAALHSEQRLASFTAEQLAAEEAPEAASGSGPVTIGELSAEAGVPRSALRYWEKEGLLSPSREEGSRYRQYSRTDLRKVLLMRTLRTVGYSEETVRLRQAVRELDASDAGEARRLALDVWQHLNATHRLQLKGMHFLYSLCRQLNLIDHDVPITVPSCDTSDHNGTGL